MKKVGLLILALVLALGALGAGYAMWSDSFVIKGTVTTGDIKFDIDDTVALSQSWAYKVIGTYPDHQLGDLVILPAPSSNTSLLKVASAVATRTGDKIQFSFSDIFPIYSDTGKELKADATIKYSGSIPVHIAYEIRNCDGTTIGANLIKGLRIRFSDGKSTPVVIGGEDSRISIDAKGRVVGPQLHTGDSFHVEAWFDATDLQSDLENMGIKEINKKCFAIRVIAHQWNEWDETQVKPYVPVAP